MTSGESGVYAVERSDPVDLDTPTAVRLIAMALFHEETDVVRAKVTYVGAIAVVSTPGYVLPEKTQEAVRQSASAFGLIAFECLIAPET